MSEPTRTKKPARPTREEWRAGYRYTIKDYDNIYRCRAELKQAEIASRLACDGWHLLLESMTLTVRAVDLAQQVQKVRWDRTRARKRARDAHRAYLKALVPESLVLFRSKRQEQKGVLETPSCAPSLRLPTPEDVTLRVTIQTTVEDLAQNFLWDDRKEDEELSRESLQHAFATNKVSVEDVVQWFRAALKERLE